MSLRVFWSKRHYLAVKVSFRVTREEITRIMQSTFKIVSFRGQKRLGHARIGLVINLKFTRAVPATFIWEAPGK